MATIQFATPVYSRDLLASLDELCAEFGEQLEVRFYGHYSEDFDASVLSALPHVQRLSVDCLTTITNEQEIGKLPVLKGLRFGVFRFDNAAFLGQIDLARLNWLCLVENDKRNFDLAPLATARALHTLFLHGHSKNVEVIADLPELSTLSLSGFPKRNGLGFLNRAPALRALTLILGGRSSIEDFRHADLEELNIIRVRGLESIGSLARFPHLERLRVEDQLQIRSIDLAGATLREVALANCKNLAELGGLDGLYGLRSFRASQTSLPLDTLVDHAWPPAMEIVALYSGKQKWNDDARAKLDARGYREFETAWN